MFTRRFSLHSYCICRFYSREKPKCGNFLRARVSFQCAMVATPTDADLRSRSPQGHTCRQQLEPVLRSAVGEPFSAQNVMRQCCDMRGPPGSGGADPIVEGAVQNDAAGSAGTSPARPKLMSPTAATSPQSSPLPHFPQWLDSPAPRSSTSRASASQQLQHPAADVGAASPVPQKEVYTPTADELHELAHAAAAMTREIADAVEASRALSSSPGKPLMQHTPAKAAHRMREKQPPAAAASKVNAAPAISEQRPLGSSTVNSPHASLSVPNEQKRAMCISSSSASAQAGCAPGCTSAAAPLQADAVQMLTMPSSGNPYAGYAALPIQCRTPWMELDTSQLMDSQPQSASSRATGTGSHAQRQEGEPDRNVVISKNPLGHVEIDARAVGLWAKAALQPHVAEHSRERFINGLSNSEATQFGCLIMLSCQGCQQKLSTYHFPLMSVTRAARALMHACSQGWVRRPKGQILCVECTQTRSSQYDVVLHTRLELHTAGKRAAIMYSSLRTGSTKILVDQLTDEERKALHTQLQAFWSRTGDSDDDSSGQP